MQNKSIAFISSPFQLLCLKEFIEEKRIEKIEIIFIQTNSSEIHNKQFFLTARYLNLKITKINHLRLRLNYIKYTAKFFLKKVKFLIVGDHFNSHFVFLSIIIKYKFFFIIDDGMSSIVIGEKDILSRSLVSKLYPKNKIYYTIFKNNRLENYIINHFNYIKKSINKKIFKDLVIILGSPLVEQKYVSHTDYLIYISNIKAKFLNKKIIYLPHRFENKNNYSKFDLEIDQTSFGFEIYLASNKFLPKAIIGFYSTALVTSRILLSNALETRIFNYEIEKLNIENEWRLQSSTLEKFNIEKF